MKSLIKIMFLVVLLFSFSIHSQDCNTTITIDSDYSEINVFINNSLYDISKKNLIILEPGEYKIVVMENSDKWDAKTFIDSFYLQKCEEKNLVYKFKDNEVLLETEPQDAYVFIDDSLAGFTPLYLKNDINIFRLSKPGYEEKMISLNENISKIKLDFTGSKPGESFLEKDLFKILMGSIIVLGGTTAYFKLKADDKFDEYQFTGDPALLDETETYDLVSGITFGALQVNFGLLIYYFLIE